MAIELLDFLARHRIRFRISYDVDYGIDKRNGYSMSIGGSHFACFEPTLEKAILKAFAAYIEIQLTDDMTILKFPKN